MERKMTKKQRYALLRGIFADVINPRDFKDNLLYNEKNTLYTCEDELERVKCLACLPDDINKNILWQKFLHKTGMNLEEFKCSSILFYNKRNVEQCEKFAMHFLENIEEINDIYHIDYSEHFFRALSPAFLGNQKHLDEF